MKTFHQRDHALRSRSKRRDIGQLRSDVAVDALDLQMLEFARAPVQRQRTVVRDAKFIFLESGGDVRMRLCIDIGIHAQTNRRDLVQATGDLVDAFEFGRRFNVKTVNSGV